MAPLGPPHLPLVLACPPSPGPPPPPPAPRPPWPRLAASGPGFVQSDPARYGHLWEGGGDTRRRRAQGPGRWGVCSRTRRARVWGGARAGRPGPRATTSVRAGVQGGRGVWGARPPGPALRAGATDWPRAARVGPPGRVGLRGLCQQVEKSDFHSKKETGTMAEKMAAGEWQVRATRTRPGPGGAGGRCVCGGAQGHGRWGAAFQTGLAVQSWTNRDRAARGLTSVFLAAPQWAGRVPRHRPGSCLVRGPCPRGYAATAVRLSVPGAARIPPEPAPHTRGRAAHRPPALWPLPLPGAMDMRGPVHSPPAGCTGLGGARPGSQRAGVTAGRAGPRAPRDGTRPGQTDIPARACDQQDVAVPAGSPLCLPPGPLAGQES